MVDKKNELKKKKNKYKYKKYIILPFLIIFAFLFLVLLDNYKFNKDLKKYSDNSKTLYVNYVVIDKENSTNKEDIATVVNDKRGIILYTFHEVVPLSKFDDKYYYADFSKFTNEKLLENVVDVEFALRDLLGNLVDDCSYNKKTKIVKIPVQYFKKNNNKTPIQIEFLSRISSKEIGKLKLNLKIKKYFTKTSNIVSEQTDFKTTRFSIAEYKSYKTEKNDIEIYLNNSSEKLTSDDYNWNSKTGVIEINYPTLLLNNIKIRLNNKILNILNFQKIDAISFNASTIDISNKSSISFDLNSKPNFSSLSDQFSLRNLTLNDNYSATGIFTDGNGNVISGISDPGIPLYAVNLYENSDFIYAYGSCTGSSTDTNHVETPATQSISDFGQRGTWVSTDRVYDIHGTSAHSNTEDTYSTACIPYLVNLSSLSNSSIISFPKAANGNDFYIPIYCIHVGAEATGTNSLWFQLTLIRYNPSERYAIIEISSVLSNTDSTPAGRGKQMATGAILITWPEDKKASINVSKSYVGGDGSSNTISVSLYKGSNCSGDLISTKNITGSSSVTFSDLSINTQYSVKETSSNSSWVSDATCKNVSTPATADSNGNYSASAAFKNHKKKYCYKVKKVDAENNSTALSGVTFSMGGQTCTTASNGKCTFTNLDYQNYTLKETSAKTGYFNENSSGTAISKTSLTLMNYDSSTNVYTCPNTANTITVKDHKIYYCMKIKKTDSQTDRGISGASYTITDVYNNSITPVAIGTSSEGVTSFFMGTQSGQYKITEKTAPTGYKASSSTYTVSTFILGSASDPKSYSDARTLCLSSDSNPTSITAIKNDKLLINFKKSDSGNPLSGVTFTITDSNGNKIGHKTSKASTKDSNGNTKSCYEYYPTSTSYTYESDSNGEVCVAKLPEGTYTVTENSPKDGHTFSSTKKFTITTGTTFKSYTDSNTFNNCPTKFVFTKEIEYEEDDSAEEKAITTKQLKKLKWHLYKATDLNNPISLLINGDGIYEYLASDVSSTNKTSTSTLYLNDSRQIEITHLPWGNYILKEDENDNCKDNNNVLCQSLGFYYPDSDVSFEINDKSSDCSTGAATKKYANTRTEITFTKSDLYNYISLNDTVKFENDEELNAFDNITFGLYDKNNTKLKLKKIKDVGRCNVPGSYSLYRYYPSDEPTSDLTSDLHTCGGKIVISNLCRENSYTIKEESVPNNSVFTLDSSSLPTVTFNIPKKESEITSTSNTQTIKDTPTRVVLKKIDASDTSSIINDESTTFNIYRCLDSSCDNKKQIYFESRSKISNDKEDNGKEVYKYSKNNTSSIFDLHPYEGEIILRYLPAGNYVAIEKTAPDGYYNPTDTNNKTYFTVSNSTVDNEYVTKKVVNDPTKIYLKKSDIYKYYTATDKVRLESQDNLLDTVKFILRDNKGNQIKLTKTGNGTYRYSSTATTGTKITTYEGSLMITHLTRGKTYYIEEVETTDEKVLILPSNKTYKNLPFDNNGHAVVTYNVPENIPDNTAVTREIENSPTRVVFYKLDSVDDKIIKDESTTFNVYQCSETVTSCSDKNGTLIYFTERGIIDDDPEDEGKEVYKYSKLNQNAIKDLHPYNGELILRYLPANYKYALVETVAPFGYYDPTINVNEVTEFIVRDESYDERSTYEYVTKTIKNEPTVIEFTKSDIYSYYKESDVVKFEDNDELKAFDDITFKLTDQDGNPLYVSKVKTEGNCLSTSSYNEYRYYEKQVSGVELTDELHTCGGNLHITHLYRGVTYKIEEVKVPDNTVFILRDIHPSVTYKIPLTKDKVTKENSTNKIENTPTRVELRKLDARTNDLVDDEKTTFNIYRCKNETCDEKTLLYFENRSTINSDNEDNQKEVYIYKKNNTSGESNLHPYQGKIILRYLPVNYKYVAIETIAPNGYYNPIETNNKTYFTVTNNTLDTTKNIINNYTRIFLKKDDVYKYYNSSDQGKLDSNEKLLDTVKFVLRDENGNILKLRKIRDGEYRYIPITSDNTIEKINTYNGSLVITHLTRNKTYYIEEVETSKEQTLILPTNKTYKNLPFDNKGHAVVTYKVPINEPEDSAVTELIENSPTRVKFNKISERTKEIVTDEKTTFNVYKCELTVSICTKSVGQKVYFTERGIIEGDKEDSGKEVYKYSKLNKEGVFDLHPYNGELILRYLPAEYKYVLVETVAPDGYYNPTISVNEETEFTVRSESYSDTTDYELLTDNIENTPTKIIFKKSDFYKYYTNTDNKASDSNEKLLDTAKFVLRDEDGNILKLKKVETNEEEGNVYRYLEVDSDNKYTEINTYKGNLTITNLYRNKVYYIEEVKSTTPKNFILQENIRYEGLPFDNEGHPVVKYTLTDTSPTSIDSVTREIENKPTRVRFEKRDSKYNYLIPDETTTFKLYMCKEGTTCHPSDPDDKNSILINFEKRAIISNDEEDSEDAEGLKGVEVYKYSKLNQSNVTELHPYHGLLIFRYLPAGYEYVLLEIKAPVNYTLPVGEDAETRFTVSGTTVDVKEVDVQNKPTSLIIRKYTDDGELLEGAEFKIYKGLTTCDVNLSAMNQPHGEALGLKTINEGHYELRPTFDTTTFKTCTDREDYKCSDINLELTYSEYDNTWADFNNSTEIEDNEEKKVEITKGEALIQYLDYGYCYIIEEVKAPKGYSLPENASDRFTMVNITDDNHVVDTYKALVNKPTPFTFYKFDEFNNPLDGAEFKLQKLNKNKVYEDVALTNEEDNDKQYYKVNNESDNFIMTTKNGSATVYYLEEGQYRIVEVKAPEGKELPAKTNNIATFFVDESGKVYGSNIITNKAKTEKVRLLASSKAELIVNIQTGQKVIKYGLIIGGLLIIISGLIFIVKKINRKESKNEI